MDVNNDGMVSEEEFKNNTRASHKKYNKHARQKMDMDNDGRVSKEEYLAIRLKWAEKKFAQLDKDSDGFLTEKERSAEKSHFKKSSHYFPKIDANADGFISLQENKASSERMFKKLDNNNDQVITQEEIQAMVETHKKAE